MSNDYDMFADLSSIVRVPSIENSSSSTSTGKRKRNQEPGAVDKHVVRKKKKNLKDQVDRMIKKYKDFDLKTMVFSVRLLVEYGCGHLIPELDRSLNQIEARWPLNIPARSALLDIKQAIDKVSTEAANDKAMDELNQVGRKMKEFKQQLAKRSEELKEGFKKREDIFSKSENHSAETLKTEQQHHASSSDFLSKKLSGRLNMEGITAADLRVRFEEHKDLEYLRATIGDLKRQLYDENNNQVEFHDFQGLKEALDKTSASEVPDSLKDIVTRIHEDRGKATGSAHNSIQILVCAAVKEMENSAEVPEWGMLKKWAATLNQARKLDFQVGFADELIKTKLCACLGLQ